MASFRIKRAAVLAALGAGSLVPALLPTASHASHAARGPCSGTGTPHAPEVVTGGAHVNGTSGELEGVVNPCYLTTTYYFQYGPTNSYSSPGSPTAPVKLPAEPAEPIHVHAAAPGLAAEDRYRLVAINAKSVDGHTYGRERIVAVKKKKPGKKSTKSALKLTGALEPKPVGEPLVISGSLTGPDNASRQIVLQATPYPYRAAFADVGAPVLTGSTGAFSFRVSKLSTSTHFRVATVSAPLLTSNVVTAFATVRVVLKVRTSKYEKGLVRLYGTVSPSEVGAHVFFELEKPVGEKPISPSKLEKAGRSKKRGEQEKEKQPTFVSKFSTTTKRATRSLARFSLVVMIQDAGSYRAFVEVPAGPLASGHSQTVHLGAEPTKHKKKKRKK